MVLSWSQRNTECYNTGSIPFNNKASIHTHEMKGADEICYVPFISWISTVCRGNKKIYVGSIGDIYFIAVYFPHTIFNCLYFGTESKA